jgi:hypothetical protein
MGRPIALGDLHLGQQTGLTYIGLLIFVAASSFAIAATFEVWHTRVQREKEAELLFIGNEFRNALQGYYEAKAANVIGQPVRRGQRPRQLADLVSDGRFASPQRWLRKIYVDPMTGASDWGLVTLPDGQITGVYSLSDKKPFKSSGFLERDVDLAGKTKYSEWVFSAKLKQVGSGSGTIPTIINTGPVGVVPRQVPNGRLRQ